MKLRNWLLWCLNQLMFALIVGMSVNHYLRDHRLPWFDLALLGVNLVGLISAAKLFEATVGLLAWQEAHQLLQRAFHPVLAEAAAVGIQIPESLNTQAGRAKR